jgi:23S rRNA pseudouridine2605 synthase
MESVRLNKYLAHTFGISRREADLRIEEGRVYVNGKPARIGHAVQPERDTIVLDDKTATEKQKRYTYLLMNKPVGYICSRKQQGDTPTVYALLPRQYHHLKVAGRLDKDSCGLLLLTDDGDTIFKLTHPKFVKQKEYEVGLNKPLTAEDMQTINSGIKLEDGISNLKVSKLTNHTKPNMYKVVMHEGRNRQIRRTFGGLRYMVTHLERKAFGKYKLSQLSNKPYLQI